MTDENDETLQCQDESTKRHTKYFKNKNPGYTKDNINKAAKEMENARKDEVESGPEKDDEEKEVATRPQKANLAKTGQRTMFNFFNCSPLMDIIH